MRGRGEETRREGEGGEEGEGEDRKGQGKVARESGKDESLDSAACRLEAVAPPGRSPSSASKPFK